jgi:hypothetical protein
MIEKKRTWLLLLGGALALLSMSASADAACSTIMGRWGIFAITGKPADHDETVVQCTIAVAANGDISGPCKKYKATEPLTITSVRAAGNLQLSACALSGTINGNTIHGGQLNGNTGAGIGTTNKGYVFLFNLVKK